MFSRVARRPVTVGGYSVRKGTEIWICPFLTHRHADFWPEPERFAPERWAGEEDAYLARIDYLPFGKGPHTCIGAGLAMIELTYVIASLLRQANIEPVHPPAIRPVAKIALATRDDLILGLRAR